MSWSDGDDGAGDGDMNPIFLSSLLWNLRPHFPLRGMIRDGNREPRNTMGEKKRAVVFSRGRYNIPVIPLLLFSSLCVGVVGGWRWSGVEGLGVAIAIIFFPFSL